MKFNRKDYNDLNQLNEKIGKDEPVFMLRAKDVLAPDILDLYAQELIMSNASEEIVQSVSDQAKEMRKWQNKNKEIVKVPDL
jgi:hypothetical protein